MIRPTPAENFRRIWTQKKRELNLTQTQAAEKLGWTQGAFSQYLNNLTDLGPATVLKLANFLGVPPTDIDPTLKEILPKKVEYPIRQTATGKPRESDTIRFLQPADKDMFVIYLDKAIKVELYELKPGVDIKWLEEGSQEQRMPQYSSLVCTEAYDRQIGTRSDYYQSTQHGLWVVKFKNSEAIRIFRSVEPPVLRNMEYVAKILSVYLV